MKKVLFSLLFLLLNGAALAESSCSDIPGKQNYAPLKVKNGLVCFIEQSVVDPKTKQTLDLEYIVVYFIPHGHEPIKAEKGELVYENNSPGKITSAFTLNINHSEQDVIVLIHYIEARHPEPNSSGNFYSVYLFDETGMGLRLNQHATDWFGSEYSSYSVGNKIVAKYPYLTQKSIIKTMTSPFATLIIRDEAIPVTVKHKSNLYNAGSYTYTYEETKKYLIAGDKAIVDKYSAGWCRINYTGGGKPLQMWMKCNALELDTEK